MMETQARPTKPRGDKSTLFTAYNAAKQVEGIDRGRLNRALGVAQTRGQSHIERYGTTATGCGCPDHRFRGALCKGMIALALVAVTS